METRGGFVNVAWGKEDENLKVKKQVHKQVSMPGTFGDANNCTCKRMIAENVEENKDLSEHRVVFVCDEAKVVEVHGDKVIEHE